MKNFMLISLITATLLGVQCQPVQPPKTEDESKEGTTKLRHTPPPTAEIVEPTAPVEESGVSAEAITGDASLPADTAESVTEEVQLPVCELGAQHQGQSQDATPTLSSCLVFYDYDSAREYLSTVKKDEEGNKEDLILWEQYRRQLRDLDNAIEKAENMKDELLTIRKRHRNLYVIFMEKLEKRYDITLGEDDFGFRADEEADAEVMDAHQKELGDEALENMTSMLDTIGRGEATIKAVLKNPRPSDDAAVLARGKQLLVLKALDIQGFDIDDAESLHKLSLVRQLAALIFDPYYRVYFAKRNVATV